MRSRLSYPGSFVPARAVVSGLDVDPSCVLCYRIEPERAWLHVAAERLVCSTCLKDPWGHNGDDGRKTAERMLAALEAEASQPVIY